MGEVELGKGWKKGAVILKDVTQPITSIWPQTQSSSTVILRWCDYNAFQEHAPWMICSD